MTAAGQHLHKTLWGLDASWREPLRKGQARCTRSSIHNRKCINAEHKPSSFLWAWTERAKMKFTHPKFCECEKLKHTFCRLLSRYKSQKSLNTSLLFTGLLTFLSVKSHLQNTLTDDYPWLPSCVFREILQDHIWTYTPVVLQCTENTFPLITSSSKITWLI